LLEKNYGFSDKSQAILPIPKFYLSYVLYLAKLSIKLIFNCFIILVTINCILSLNLRNNPSNRQGFISWSPTSANIIDDDGPSSYYAPSYYYPGFVQVATPHTSNAYTASGNIYPSHPVPYGYGYYYSANAPSYSIYYRNGPDLENPSSPLNNQDMFNKNSMSSTLPIKEDYSNLYGDIKKMKLELFGNSEEDMALYRSNKKGNFDKAWLDRAHKIDKILELEELLDFYQKSHNSSQANKSMANSKVEKKIENQPFANLYNNANKYNGENDKTKKSDMDTKKAESNISITVKPYMGNIVERKIAHQNLIKN